MPEAALPRSNWIPSALLAGVSAGAAGSLVIALGYYLRYPTLFEPELWLPWSAAIIAFGLVSGGLLALSICGGIVRARRRAARGETGWRASDILGASIGAVVGGVFPSVVGVVGYGSMSLPYAGTDVASMAVFVCFMLLAGLGSLPSSLGERDAGPRGPALAASALAACLVVIPFGLTIAGLVTSELPLPVIRDIVDALGGAGTRQTAFGLGAFALVMTAALGVFVGSFIALTARLATLLRALWTPRRA